MNRVVTEAHNKLIQIETVRIEHVYLESPVVVGDCEAKASVRRRGRGRTARWRDVVWSRQGGRREEGKGGVFMWRGLAFLRLEGERSGVVAGSVEVRSARQSMLEGSQSLERTWYCRFFLAPEHDRGRRCRTKGNILLCVKSI